MRTFEDIHSDAERALIINNATLLMDHATELESVGTSHASSLANFYRGSALNLRGDYPEALEHYRRAMALCQETGDRLGEARATSGIGNVYVSTGDHTAALANLHRALELQEELDDRLGLARTICAIGNVHLGNGDYPVALQHYHRAHTLYEDLGNSPGVATCQIRKLDAYVNMGADAEALELLHNIDRLRVDDPAARADRNLQRAALQQRGGDIEAAIETLRGALTDALEFELRPAAAQTHLRLRELALLSNDFPKYIEHNNEYGRISEEIRGQQATQRLAMFEADRRMEAERREREKERALLYGTLPRAVADRMIRGEVVSGDHFSSAAVLFADMAGFSSGTSSLEASQVVMILEHVFDAFDRICDEHAVVKVKTIGDSYMCFKGDGAAADNVAALARTALEMHQSTFTWPDGSPIQFRIGLHMGPIAAGVIGTQRLQYDIWGDTVNVASRMKSTGEPGRVHVSSEFARSFSDAAAPADSCTLSMRGEVDVKGKGIMTTYWLEGR